MNTLEAIKTRHSYRGAYKSDAIPEGDLVKILDAGLRAPSGCNAQTTSFIVVTCPTLRAQIAEVLPNVMTETAPVLVVAVTQKVTFDFGLDFELEDYGAAVENILLAVTALGYASCWLDGQTRLGGVAEKLAALLGVEENMQVRSILPIGIPVEKRTQPVRKPFDERVQWRR